MQPNVQMWIVAAVALGLTAYAWREWRRHGQAIDLRYTAASLPWLILSVVGQLGELGWLGGHEAAATRVAYQLLVLGVSFFLVAAVKGLRALPGYLLLVQAPLGLLLALMQAPAGWGAAWFWVNAVLSTALVVYLAQAIWRRASPKVWMVLLISISGLGVMLTDMREAGQGPITVSVLHYFFAVGLFVLWLALSRRVGAQMDSVMPADEERQRLAQDLHDGVASQLASIISALDMGTPQQRATAASLQQCMVELKLLVDGVDSDASVLSLLASLRYRMQPLLEAGGIELRWRIADEAVLDRVQGDAARQVLRIAQEALANAVRHSCANRVTLTCCQVKSRQALLMEVADNGVGMTPALRTISGAAEAVGGHRLGKGLSGMERRARRLGGRLAIDAARGQGTRVRLLVPLARLLEPESSQRARLA